MEVFQDDSSTIVTSTMFKLGVPGGYSEEYHYSRYKNPTRDVLESSFASLDGGKFAVTYCSGIAAKMAILNLLKADELVVFSDLLSCFEFKKLYPRLQTKVQRFEDLNNFEESFNPNTKMVWIELPTIFMEILDIKAIAAIVHKFKAILVVDNTFSTSHFRKPLQLGADIAVYSLNEFVGGHGDVNMGAAVTNDEKYFDKLRYHQYAVGMVPSPFDCFMMSRSLKTLGVRMEKHSENSLTIAKFLKSHENVEKVFHPILKFGERSKCEVENVCGNSGVLSFSIKGNFENTNKFLQALKLVKVSKALGSCDSTVSFPWSMSHSEISQEQKLDFGVSQTLLTFSAGLEHVNKVINDLDQALNQIFI